MEECGSGGAEAGEKEEEGIVRVCGFMEVEWRYCRPLDGQALINLLFCRWIRNVLVLL
jgi:hypothetical protein